MSNSADYAPMLMENVRNSLKIWLGTDRVYSVYQPKKESCEITAYINVYGISYRLDWEYDVPLDIKRSPSLEKVVSEITEYMGKHIAALWAAGPE